MTDSRHNIHTLSVDERRGLLREQYNAQSRFQKEFGVDGAALSIGEHGNALRNEVIRLLVAKGVKEAGDVPLEKLHTVLSPEMKAYGFDDGVNKLSTLLYDADAQFVATYHRFIKEAVTKHFAYPFYFQATTTVRVHCPDGENNHHYPRYHSDISYGHPPEEINIWIPLTAPQAPQQHGFRRMSVADSRDLLAEFDYDFAPFISKVVAERDYNFTLHDRAPQQTAQLGEMLAFDSRCIHTGEPLENHTRASIDIRILPVADYERMDIQYQGTGRRRVLYAPGECYHSLSSSEL